MASVAGDGNYHLPVLAVVGEDPLEAVAEIEELVILRNPTFENSGLHLHRRAVDVHLTFVALGLGSSKLLQVRLLGTLLY